VNGLEILSKNIGEIHERLIFDSFAKSYKKLVLTSFLVTGFSTNTRCVNRIKSRSGSRSASSAILFEVRNSAVRVGIDEAMVG
jgi:hypothetical protein